VKGVLLAKNTQGYFSLQDATHDNRLAVTAREKGCPPPRQGREPVDIQGLESPDNPEEVNTAIRDLSQTGRPLITGIESRLPAKI
jgi:hypothetical protein